MVSIKFMNEQSLEGQYLCHDQYEVKPNQIDEFLTRYDLRRRRPLNDLSADDTGIVSSIFKIT